MEWLKALPGLAWRCACGAMKVMHAARSIVWLLDRWNDHHMQ